MMTIMTIMEMAQMRKCRFQGITRPAGPVEEAHCKTTIEVEVAGESAMSENRTDTSFPFRPFFSSMRAMRFPSRLLSVIWSISSLVSVHDLST